MTISEDEPLGMGELTAQANGFRPGWRVGAAGAEATISDAQFRPSAPGWAAKRQARKIGGAKVSFDMEWASRS